MFAVNDTHHSTRQLQRARLLAALGALAMAALFGLLWDAPLGIRSFFLFIVLVGVLLRSAVLAWGSLVWVWGWELIVDARTLGVSDYVGITDVVLAAALLGSLLYTLRYVALNEPPLEGARFEIPRYRRFRSLSAPALPRARVPACRLDPITAAPILPLLAVGLALLILRMLPIQAMASNTAQLLPSAQRVVLLAWGLAGTGIVIASLFAILHGRQLTPWQAALSLRRAWADEMWREMALVERARARRLRRSNRR